MNLEISKKLAEILNRIFQSDKSVTKLGRFFANLIAPKTKQNKTSSLNKPPQRLSPDVKIKQIDHTQQQAITSFFEQTFDPVTQSPPTVITVSKECISELEPGVVIDACGVMSFEDFPEIRKYGRDITKKLENKPIYVLDTTKKEYRRKRCAKDRFEIVRDVEYTGKPRNFNNTLAELQKSLGADVYYVEIENSSELHRKANECIRKFKCHKPDNMYLAFACVTNSAVLTLDGGIISSAKKAKVKSIDFHKFLDKIMDKAPMTIIAEKRTELNKKLAHPILTFGNLNSFRRDY